MGGFSRIYADLPAVGRVHWIKKKKTHFLSSISSAVGLAYIYLTSTILHKHTKKNLNTPWLISDEYITQDISPTNSIISEKIIFHTATTQ